MHQVNKRGNVRPADVRSMATHIVPATIATRESFLKEWRAS